MHEKDISCVRAEYNWRAQVEERPWFALLGVGQTFDKDTVLLAIACEVDGDCDRIFLFVKSEIAEKIVKAVVLYFSEEEGHSLIVVVVFKRFVDLI